MFKLQSPSRGGEAIQQQVKASGTGFAIGIQAALAARQGVTTASTGSTNLQIGNLITGINLEPLLGAELNDEVDMLSYPPVLMRLYRDMYYFDSVAGATFDLYAQLPFGKYTLAKLDDKRLAPFQQTLERLNLETLFPQISIDRNVQGVFMGSLLYHKESKTITDLMCLMPEDCEFTHMPLYGQDPIIEYRPPERLKKFMSSKLSRAVRTQERMGNFLNGLKKGKAELDPLTTLFLPRRTLTSRTLGTSALKRILPIYLVEKSLWRGTLIESTRRIRSILHVIMGNDQWEPSVDDMQAVSNLFTSADADPLGAIVATRDGVQTSEIRCLAGNTTISTNRGLMRLDKMVPHDPDQLAPGTRFDCDLLVKNNTGSFAKVKYWWYQGKKQVQTLTTDSGYELTGTKNHKLVTVANGSLQEVKFGDVVLGETYALVECNSNLRPAKDDWVKYAPSFQLSLVVKRVEHELEEHVYDLTMDEHEGPPVFVANSVLTRNSGGEFWSIFNIWNDTTAAKLRALGVSESFLSGDATYASMEQSVSTFMENLRAHREEMTQSVLYNRLFPLIALTNGFIKDKKLLPLELKNWKSGKITREDVARALTDTRGLMIPEMVWSKTLEPHSDPQMIDVLNTLSEKGVPVFLRTWAAAGGIDMDEILEGADKDVQDRKLIAEYKKKLGGGEGGEGKEGEGEGGGDEFSGEFSENLGVRKLRKRASDPTHRVFGRPSPLPLLARDYGNLNELRTPTKSGRGWKPIRDQKNAHHRMNKLIAKATTKLNKEKRDAAKAGSKRKG